MKAYLDIVRRILDRGIKKPNRTGVEALTLPGAMFEHDLEAGFPLLTTKSVPFRLVASELEFFIKGITDKDWLRSRNNHIWDEWCSPERVPYGHDDETRAKMMAERELGPIYGWQWRNFGAEYVAHDRPPRGQGIDQLQSLVEKLKSNPEDRRMLVSAWNPVDFHRMALPPCHYGFQVTVLGGKLNLMWNQRSVDVALGLPFNIASYALLLHLLAREAGLGDGRSGAWGRAPGGLSGRHAHLRQSHRGHATSTATRALPAAQHRDRGGKRHILLELRAITHRRLPSPSQDCLRYRCLGLST
jgi:thymidylate synthase